MLGPSLLDLKIAEYIFHIYLGRLHNLMVITTTELLFVVSPYRNLYLSLRHFTTEPVKPSIILQVI